LAAAVITRCRPLPQQPELNSLRYYAVEDEVPLGRFVRILLRQLAQELLKSGGPARCFFGAFAYCFCAGVGGG
jgi:hypothetical protein